MKYANTYKSSERELCRLETFCIIIFLKTPARFATCGGGGNMYATVPATATTSAGKGRDGTRRAPVTQSNVSGTRPRSSNEKFLLSLLVLRHFLHPRLLASKSLVCREGIQRGTQRKEIWREASKESTQSAFRISGAGQPPTNPFCPNGTAVQWPKL